MSKFYAVRAGHQPGIYDTWAECQKQISGFRGAQFKSFTTREDAEAFAAGQEIPGDLAAKKVKGADKFYAVARGIQPGIYTEWTACQEAIEGAKGPKYKKFGTKAEAEDFIRLNGTAATVLGMGLAGNYDDPDAAYDEEDEQDDDEGVEVKQEVKKLEAAGVKVVSPSEAPPAGMGRDGVLRIYTDGSSRGNGKVGALAGVGVYFGKNDPRNLAEPLQGQPQTNQRAELTAILRALQISAPNQDVQILTDSQYSINCVTVWYKNWLKNSWKTKSGPVKNRDLVEAIRARIDERTKRGAKTTFEWVRGHDTNASNIEADHLAVMGSQLER